MGTRLYVGNLSYEVTERELADTFAGVGQVEKAEVIRDGASGKPKGFGFVDMRTDEDARDAIKTLDGSFLRGRKMRVDLAKPRPERRAGGGDFGGYS